MSQNYFDKIMDEIFGKLPDQRKETPAKPRSYRYRVESLRGKVTITGEPREVFVNGVCVWRRAEVSK